MESLNALIQGMGLMHLGAGQAVMLLVSLLLLWLAIARKFEPLLLLPIGFGGRRMSTPSGRRWRWPCRRCRGRWRSSPWIWATPPGCWPSSIRSPSARVSPRW
ncbi:oxaloacetate decarboxylase subunit beta [Klebsiella michiganensis]|nr:oxaloacetate decarboxylase subunit beta [Klebsiella michiganensis]